MRQHFLSHVESPLEQRLWQGLNTVASFLAMVGLLVQGCGVELVELFVCKDTSTLARMTAFVNTITDEHRYSCKYIC